MQILDPGHRYLLAHLHSEETTMFQFFKDGDIHGPSEAASGPWCQEVIRMLIDRVQSLDAERPWPGNADIIYDLRHALAGFEARAVIRHVEKEGFPIETAALAQDGHLALK